MSIKTYELKEAERKSLMQLTTWVRDIPNEHTFLKRMYDGVMDDILVKRVAMVVQKGGLLALFVNRVAK